MDDVHQREGDGQAGDSQRPHPATDKDAIYNIIYRGDDLADHRRQRILPQQTADVPRFKFLCSI